MQNLYIFPVFVAKRVLSYYWSDSASKEITYIKKSRLSELENFIANEKYQKIVCFDFKNIFKSNIEKHVIDIEYIKKLYKHDFNNFEKKYKDNDVITKFNTSKELIINKKKSFEKISPILVNGKYFESLPISIMIPEHALHDIAVAHIDYIKFVDKNFVEKTDIKYFDLFKHYLFVYNNLNNAKINNEFIEKIIKKQNYNHIVEKVIKFYKTENKEKLEVPKYELFSSKTGRPYINRGTNYQQLPTQFKQVIKSKWDQGKLYEIDFNGCEIRTALFCTGNKKIANIECDIYEHFLKLVKNKLSVILTRKRIKNLLIPMLFGASIKTISNLIKCSEPVVKQIIKIISSEFDFKGASKAINHEIKKKSYFTNFFGRPIYTDNDSHMSKLIQNYIQSSAADICHMGYSNFLNYVKQNNLQTIIIYTRHDSICIDVHPDEINLISKFEKLIGTKSDLGIKFLTVSKEIK